MASASCDAARGRGARTSPCYGGEGRQSCRFLPVGTVILFRQSSRRHPSVRREGPARRSILAHKPHAGSGTTGRSRRFGPAPVASPTAAGSPSQSRRLPVRRPRRPAHPLVLLKATFGALAPERSHRIDMFDPRFTPHERSSFKPMPPRTASNRLILRASRKTSRNSAKSSTRHLRYQLSGRRAHLDDRSARQELTIHGCAGCPTSAASSSPSRKRRSTYSQSSSPRWSAEAT